MALERLVLGTGCWPREDMRADDRQGAKPGLGVLNQGHASSICGLRFCRIDIIGPHMEDKAQILRESRSI